MGVGGREREGGGKKGETGGDAPFSVLVFSSYVSFSYMTESNFSRLSRYFLGTRIHTACVISTL